MAEGLVITHVNLSQSFCAADAQTLLLMRALERRPVNQKLIVRKGSPLEVIARQWGLLVQPITPALWSSHTKLEKCDLIHAHGRGSWGWAAAKSYPFVASVDEPITKRDRLLEQSSCVVAATRSMVEQLHAYMPYVPVERIPPMFDDEPPEMQGPLVERCQRFADQKFVFGVCCSYAASSGIEDALEAMRWLVTRKPQAGLLVWGFDRLSRGLRARMRTLETVCLLENQHYQAGGYALFDAYVAPSRHAVDDSGVVQAMRSGLAVIATQLPSTGDFVQHNHSAVFVPSMDAEALGQAMSEVMDDSRLQLRLGEVARRHSESFAPQVVAERVFRLYQSICSQPFRRRG